MDHKTRILKRADELLAEGREVLATEYPSGGKSYVDNNMLHRWNMKCRTLVGSVEPDNGHYRREFADSSSVFGTNATVARNWMATMEAFRDDVDADMFMRVEDLVSADIFEDLLGQAEHLVGAGYEAPAAALAGAVLERELRVLAQRQNLWKKGDKLNSLNQKLVSARVYTAVSSKKIETWTKVRNHADHGEFNQVKKDDVRQMIDGVRDFLDSMISP